MIDYRPILRRPVFGRQSESGCSQSSPLALPPQGCRVGSCVRQCRIQLIRPRKVIQRLIQARRNGSISASSGWMTGKPEVSSKMPFCSNRRRCVRRLKDGRRCHLSSVWDSRKCQSYCEIRFIPARYSTKAMKTAVPKMSESGIRTMCGASQPCSTGIARVIHFPRRRAKSR